jgi:hypothetical protein
VGECIAQGGVYDHVIGIIEAERKLIPLFGYDTSEAGASGVDWYRLYLGRFIQEKAAY